MSRLKNIAIAVDQLVNTLVGGYPDETMSARCWQLRAFQPYKTLRPIIDTLFWFDKDHCRTSYESEVNRTQARAVTSDASRDSDEKST